MPVQRRRRGHGAESCRIRLKMRAMCDGTAAATRRHRRRGVLLHRRRRGHSAESCKAHVDSHVRRSCGPATASAAWRAAAETAGELGADSWCAWQPSAAQQRTVAAQRGLPLQAQQCKRGSGGRRATMPTTATRCRAAATCGHCAADGDEHRAVNGAPCEGYAKRAAQARLTSSMARAAMRNRRRWPSAAALPAPRSGGAQRMTLCGVPLRARRREQPCKTTDDGLWR